MTRKYGMGPMRSSDFVTTNELNYLRQEAKKLDIPIDDMDFEEEFEGLTPARKQWMAKRAEISFLQKIFGGVEVEEDASTNGLGAMPMPVITGGKPQARPGEIIKRKHKKKKKKKGDRYHYKESTVGKANQLLNLIEKSTAPDSFSVSQTIPSIEEAPETLGRSTSGGPSLAKNQISTSHYGRTSGLGLAKPQAASYKASSPTISEEPSLIGGSASTELSNPVQEPKTSHGQWSAKNPSLDYEGEIQTSPRGLGKNQVPGSSY